MFIYAGIDEAGYGPMFGPLLVGRAVVGVDQLDAGAVPDLWQRLEMAVCRDLRHRRGRIVINDSKKVYSPATGLRRLEEGVLAFAALSGHRPQSLDQWLDMLGESRHHDLAALPWYAPSHEQPWQQLPCACAAGELAIALAMLRTTAKAAGVKVLDLGAAVVFEDHFNQMLSTTRSKAATTFTFVSRHLDTVWRRFGRCGPTVVVDRQSGRQHYRELLAQMFRGARLIVVDESAQCSVYRLESSQRRMIVKFEVEADCHHLPVALASMLSKYTRELLMARFQRWFGRRVPQVKPTAGYARDARRFWHQIEPMLAQLSIAPDQLRRRR